MNKSSICKIAFFALMLALLLSLAVGASAECNPETGHDGPFRYVSIKEPDCTNTGSREKWCNACGKMIGIESILPIGHQLESSSKVITEPTCLETGHRQTTTICMVCKYVDSVINETLPALGHLWGAWYVETPATCTESGLSRRICQRDSSHQETQPISPIGHDWGDWVRTKEPTCTEPGKDTKTCKNDPAHTQTRNVDPLGHDWDDGKITKQPDCTNPGVLTYTCKRDPSHTKTESIPIVPDAHKWDNGKVTKKPNCTEPGVLTYTCTINPAHTKTESIPIEPDAHDWGPGQVKTPATCDNPGVIEYVCRINPAHTKTETIPATGHDWDNGKVTKPATLTEEGEKTYTCKNDPSHTKTEKIPKLTLSGNTVCAFGPRLRDVNLYPYNTDVWYMFTPFDASRDGVQTYELVASNQYIVGELTLTIKNGNVTVDYTLVDNQNFKITLEFFTILNRIGDLTRYEPEDLKAMGLGMTKNKPVNLAETFGDDTSLVLYFCSRCDYSYSARYTGLAYNSLKHRDMLKTMLALMD